jgi:hypothetical protein
VIIDFYFKLSTIMGNILYKLMGLPQIATDEVKEYNKWYALQDPEVKKILDQREKEFKILYAWWYKDYDSHLYSNYLQERKQLPDHVIANINGMIRAKITIPDTFPLKYEDLVTKEIISIYPPVQQEPKPVDNSPKDSSKDSSLDNSQEKPPEDKPPTPTPSPPPPTGNPKRKFKANSKTVVEKSKQTPQSSTSSKISETVPILTRGKRSRSPSLVSEEDGDKRSRLSSCSSSASLTSSSFAPSSSCTCFDYVTDSKMFLSQTMEPRGY